MSLQESVKNEIDGSFIRRISFFEYLFMFVLIIYGGRASKFVENLSLITNPIGCIIPVLLSIILVIRWRVVFKKQFYLLILGFFIYFLIICTKFGDFRPTLFLSYAFIFFVVYSAVKALKFDLFRIYEIIVYYLAIFGLFMWFIQSALGGNALFNYFSSIPSIIPFSNVTGNGLNAIFYSVQPSISSFLYQSLLPRNCGYAWEPGAYADYICLAIFVNLFFTSADKNNKRRFWVLAASLISTQSTSGYVIFVVIILYHYFNKKLHILIFLFPVIIAALIFLSSLPFMRNKIVFEFNQGNEMDAIVANSIASQVGYAPGRALSFRVAYRNFRDNPLFGLGTHETESWTYKLGAKISQVSGIGFVLAQFGLVGFFFLVFYSIKSSFFFSKHYKYNGGILLFLIIILISISYTMIVLPLVMSFWMFTMFETDNTGAEEKADDILAVGEKEIED